MQFLLEIPFVMTLAEWIWGQDPAVAPDVCVASLFSWNNNNNNNNNTASCWSTLAVKVLGVAIIAGACLNKAPMIYNIWSSQSTVGLSTGALYGELLVVANASFYGLLMHYPFTAYGEAVALAVQAAILIAFQWRLATHPTVTMREKQVATAGAVAYVVGVGYLLPSEWYSLLMASMWPLQVYAKGAQIYESARVQHTGAQAILTILMNVVGSALRIWTTLKEVGWDWSFLTGSFLSVGLNGIILIQYVVYRKQTAAFLASLEQEKKKAE